MDNGAIISQYSNFCFDVFDSKGPNVQSYPCNGQPNQNFIYDTNDKTIKNGDKCLQPTEYKLLQVWAGKLEGGAYAVAVMLLNRGQERRDIIARWSEIGLPAGEAVFRDLWARRDIGTFTDSYTASVDPHSSYLLKITPK